MIEKKATKDITAVVLAGSRDFGRCPIASRLPSALWPIAGTPVLELLLKSLSEQGIKKIIVCTSDDVSLLKQNINLHGSVDVKFLEEKLPVGTAGCMREAVSAQQSSLLLVIPAALVALPDIEALCSANVVNESELTVVLEPSANNFGNSVKVPNIFICKPDVLAHIPPSGYFDIKEGLIPALVKNGQTVRTVTVKEAVGNFRNVPEYLQAVALCLQRPENSCLNLPLNGDNSEGIWISESARISPSVKMYGPVVILEDVRISNNAVILGPAVIESKARIGSRTLIDGGIIWENASIGNNCDIRNCVIDYDAMVPEGTQLQGQAVTGKPGSILPANNKKSRTGSVPRKLKSLNLLFWER